MSTPVLVLFGPTASGKTDLLEELFCDSSATGIHAEVVSADSMQVYRGMDIGTAKPSAALCSKLPHHLIDILSPNEPYNAGDFVNRATQAVRDIAARGALPVLSGGTGFYLKNFILGLPETPPSDSDIRRALKEELLDRGTSALMADLSVCDPISAARIHPNDEYRLLRALEVFRLTGKPLSSFAMNAPAMNIVPMPAEYRFLTLSLERSRDELYERINERCARMFKSGLAEEVRSLIAAGYGSNAPGMRAIGYREFFDESGALRNDLTAVEELVARHSRNYAKRQATYFASIPHTTRVDLSACTGERRGREELSRMAEDFFREK